MKSLSIVATLSLTLSVALVSCTSPQRPVQFSIASEKSEAMPRLRNALAQQGHETAYIDPEAGILRTRWIDTGFMLGKVHGETATIVRRYTIVLKGQSPNLTLTIRADTKRCAQHNYHFTGEMVTGACEGMNEMVSQHQKELDALGGHLQATL